MSEIPIWVIWLSFGALLIVGELFSATFILLCFGLGAVLTAGVASLGFTPAVQWGAFFIVSLLCVAYSRRFAEKYSGEPTRRAGVDRLIGVEAIVIERIDGSAGTGRIRVLHEEWRANPQNGTVFEENERVLVTGVHGTHLTVTKCEVRDE